MSFLLDVLTDDARLSVCTSIYAAVQRVNDLPFGFLSSYGKFFSAPEVLKLDEGIPSMFKSTVEKREESGLRWLASVFIANPSVFKSYPVPGPVTDLKRAVFVALSKPADAVTPLISQLATAIGLKNLKDELPPTPWTVETLGEPLYRLIAKEGGYFDPDREPENYRPSLGALGILETKDNAQ